MTLNPRSLLVPPPRGGGVAYVTGAHGFVGSHVTKAFAAAGWRIARLGRADDPISRRMLGETAEDVGGPDVVVHCAGAGSVGPSLIDPEGDYQRNVASLDPVLAFLGEDAPQARLVFLSSAAVYGSDHLSPIAETAPLTPISPYGRHKRLAEERVADSGLDAVCLRLFSIYGPGLRKQLMWDIVRRLAAGADPLRLSGTGQELRDYLHIDDAVRLIGRLSVAEAPPSVVNGGSGVATSVEQVAGLLCAAAGASAPIVFTGEVRAGDPASLVADIAQAGILGFEPEVELTRGVAEFSAWARKALQASETSGR